MSWIPSFEIDSIYTNQEIMAEFHCGNMGGMRRSVNRKCLVLICDHTKMYDDKWENGILHYTGMGKVGNQTLEERQNGVLYYSNTNGVVPYLFEVMKKRNTSIAVRNVQNPCGFKTFRTGGGYYYYPCGEITDSLYLDNSL